MDPSLGPAFFSFILLLGESLFVSCSELDTHMRDNQDGHTHVRDNQDGHTHVRDNQDGQVGGSKKGRRSAA